VRAPLGRVGREHACPSRARHHGESHRGPIHAPTEAFVPLMMGCTLYKGAHTLAPPYFYLIPGLQLLTWLLVGILGRSLGAHPHFLLFFHSN
jgi:hypothetical protein